MRDSHYWAVMNTLNDQYSLVLLPKGPVVVPRIDFVPLVQMSTW